MCDIDSFEQERFGDRNQIICIEGNNPEINLEENFGNNLTFSFNLENFNEDKQKGPILTSPRSLEACALCGVDPVELIRRPFKWFRRGPKSECVEFLQLRQENHERERQKLLQQVREERKKLIQEHESQSPKPCSPGVTPIKGPNEAQLLEREHKQLERTQKRRQTELEQAMTLELQRALEREEYNRKVSIAKQQQNERAKKIAERQRNIEQHKHQRDQQRWAREQEEQAKKNELQQKMRAQEQERVAKEQERQNLIQKRLWDKENETQAHLLKHKNMLQTTPGKESDTMRKAMDMKTLALRAHREEKRRSRQRELSEKQKLHVLRQEEAKKSHEQFTQQREQKLRQKLMEHELRKAELDRQQEINIMMQRKKAEERAAELAQVKMLAEQLENEKREQFLIQQQADEERLKHRRMLEERQNQITREQNARQLRLRMEGAKEQLEKKIEGKVQGTLKKLNAKEITVLTVQEEQKKRNEMLREQNRIKEEEKRRMVDRMKRAEEYKRSKKEQMLEIENMRAEKFKAMKDELIQKKKKIIDDTYLLKKTMVSEFEKMKIHGLSSATKRDQFFNKLSSTMSTPGFEAFNATKANSQDGFHSNSKGNQSRAGDTFSALQLLPPDPQMRNSSDSFFPSASLSARATSPSDILPGTPKKTRPASAAPMLSSTKAKQRQFVEESVESKNSESFQAWEHAMNQEAPAEERHFAEESVESEKPESFQVWQHTSNQENPADDESNQMQISLKEFGQMEPEKSPFVYGSEHLGIGGEGVGDQDFLGLKKLQELAGEWQQTTESDIEGQNTKKKIKKKNAPGKQLKDLKKLRDQHKKLLMKVLDEEQKAEQKREFILEMNADDKKTVEKLQDGFTKQRNRASQQILWITNRYEEIITAIDILEKRK